MRLRARGIRSAVADDAAVRRRLLVALADSGDVDAACRAVGVSRGRLLALLAEDAGFQARWEGLSAARTLLLDWALADRAFAALAGPTDVASALPDKAAVALAQWVIDQRGRPRGRPGAAVRADRPAARPGDAIGPDFARPGDRQTRGADDGRDDEAEIAALIETVRARIEAAEAEAMLGGKGGQTGPQPGTSIASSRIMS